MPTLPQIFNRTALRRGAAGYALSFGLTGSIFRNATDTAIAPSVAPNPVDWEPVPMDGGFTDDRRVISLGELDENDEMTEIVLHQPGCYLLTSGVIFGEGEGGSNGGIALNTPDMYGGWEPLVLKQPLDEASPGYAGAIAGAAAIAFPTIPDGGVRLRPKLFHQDTGPVGLWPGIAATYLGRQGDLAASLYADRVGAA